MADAVENQDEYQCKISRSTEKTKEYLFIDHGDKIRADVKSSQLEVQKQVDNIHKEITLIWEILRDFMIVLIPMTIGWLCVFISKMLFSEMLEGLMMAFNGTLLAGFVFMFVPQMNESIVRLIAAFEEFKDLRIEQDQFVDPVLEVGHGDTGYRDVITVSAGVDQEDEGLDQTGESTDNTEDNTNNNEIL